MNLKKISKRITATTLSVATILSSFAPMVVNADGQYVLTFTIDNNAQAEHTMVNEGGHLKIDGQFIDPREANNYTVGCEENSCTITITDGAATTLNISQDASEAFDLFAGGNLVNNNTNFTGTTNIQIQDHSVQPAATNPNVTFTGTVNEGNVTYTIGDATVTASVQNKNIPNDTKALEIAPTDDITLSGFDVDTMQVKIIDNNPEDPEHVFSMILAVTNNTVHVSNNGPLPGNLNFVIEAKPNNQQNNENTNQNENQENAPIEPQFDGKAYILWSCSGGGICMKHFNDIPSNDDGKSTFYKDTSIVDARTGETFNVNAKYKAWSTDAKFNNWVAAYKSYKNIPENEDIDWSTVKPEDMIGDPIDVRPYEDAAILANACTKDEPQDVFEDCVNNYAASQGVWVARAQLQPVGEPSDNNAYVSYGDRNFKVVVYNSNFKGVSIGDLSDLNYYPAEWANSFLRQDQFDISDTTKDKPTTINTVLLEKTINIKPLNYNGFAINKIEALDVPKDAVSISKVNGEWKLVFASNFYDNVKFKVTDGNGKVSYFAVKRYTVDAWVNNVNNVPHLYAEFYFDKTKSYTDFDLSAKIEYKDGTTENVKLTPYNKIDDGLGNITEAYEADESNPKYGPAGKGLKKSVFIYKLPNGKTDRDIKKAYVNVEYKGSTEKNYAGAFAGSGKGALANIYQGEES